MSLVYATHSTKSGHATHSAKSGHATQPIVSGQAVNVDAELKRIFEAVKSRDPHQPEYLQAVEEVMESLAPLMMHEPKYLPVLEALVEPERVIQFRVPWFDEAGNLHVNRGYRVQFNSAIGPYKGGLRLHPTVNQSVLKFLGLEETLKNSLTGLPMGSGKGGSDFDPKGKSDFEVRAFCQSFMTELCRHIGADTDVPEGDMGVSGREIGFLFGQYKKIRNEFAGILTGKAHNWGGSMMRSEATGYGAVYFAEHLLKSIGHEIKGKTAVVSGSGNAAQYTCKKLMQLGAKVLSVSDSDGVMHYEEGMTEQQLKDIIELKNVKRGRLSHLNHGGKYLAQKSVWDAGIKAQVAFPSATENEIDSEKAKALVANGAIAVVEVADMPSTKAAIKMYKEKKIAFAPAKAANAGGVGVSGMEMAQNCSHQSWPFDKVDEELKKMMKHIYDEAVEKAEKYATKGDLQAGANIAGFLKVADAMLDQGIF